MNITLIIKFFINHLLFKQDSKPPLKKIRLSDEEIRKFDCKRIGKMACQRGRFAVFLLTDDCSEIV